MSDVARQEMKPEYLDQLTKWFDEEREVFKTKGVKGEILEESAMERSSSVSMVKELPV